MQDTVVVDSGPCIALFDRDDEYHQAAIDFVKHTPARLVSTLAVVTEVMYVLDFSLRATRLSRLGRRGGPDLDGTRARGLGSGRRADAEILRLANGLHRRAAGGHV